MTQREHGRLGGLSNGPDAQERRTVAVLTLGRGGGARETRWLAQALTALLERELAYESRLRILPAKESRRAEEALGIGAGTLPAGMLARMRERLGVDLIISGDCQLLEDAAGTGVRLVARVQDARTGALVAHVQAVGPDDAPGLAESVSEALRKQLGGPVAPGMARRPSPAPRRLRGTDWRARAEKSSGSGTASK